MQEDEGEDRYPSLQTPFTQIPLGQKSPSLRRLFRESRLSQTLKVSQNQILVSTATNNATNACTCVSYVRARARARTGYWDAAFPLWVFQFPGMLRARQMGGGDTRWRQPRTPAPASRCSIARLGEWRGNQGWSCLA